MQVDQMRWTKESGWSKQSDIADKADLVLFFADVNCLSTEECYAELKGTFPQAIILGCSSAGSVMGVEISDKDVVATAIKFERSSVRMAVVDIDEEKDASQLGQKLMGELSAPDLKHVFVLSDGLQVNGSDLAKGMNISGIPVTGGLAGDGPRFGETWVMADAPAKSGRIAALGFYGDTQIKSGCFAGWVEFGPERAVTKSKGNVVYEIDGQPALELYKKYLGEQADELPASGLRFPLSIQKNKTEKPLIRTLLAVSEDEQSLTFAGDVPEGYISKLMRTDIDKLIDSAGMAADFARPSGQNAVGLCLVVSCVGRRLVMGQLTEEELEIVREKLGDATAITGFYSYGEMAPFGEIMLCQLHNQTMTLTTIYE